MNEKLMKFVLNFRIAIYAIGIAAFAGSYLYHHLQANEPIQSEDAFWPPDMVPHPHPPQPAPKDDDLAYHSQISSFLTIV